MAYRNHIKSLLLQHAGFSPSVAEKKAEEYTGKEEMKLFEEAITHSSIDPNNNYDLLELYGDTKLNEFASEYIRLVRPEVVNIQWLDKLRHHLQSREIFMKFTFTLGLDKFLLIDRTNPIIKSIFDNKTGAEQRRYEKLMGDVSEAFFQALFMVARRHSTGVGVAYQVCYNFAMKLFQATVGDLPLDYGLYFDAKTLLKETVERAPHNWIEKGNINSIKRTIVHSNGVTEVSFVGFINGRTNPPVVIGTATDFNAHKAEQKAALDALKTIENTKYLNMSINIPDYKSRTVKPLR